MDYWQESEGSRTLHFSKYLQMYLFVTRSLPKVSSTHFSLNKDLITLLFHLDTPADAASSQMCYERQERVYLLLGLLSMIAKLSCLTQGLYLLPVFHSWFWLQYILLFLVFQFSLKEIPDFAEQNDFLLKKIKLKQYAITLLALGCVL